MVKSVFEQTARIGNRQLKTSVYFSFYAVMGDGGPGMQSSNVAVWLVNLSYRQSTDNAASVNAMVTHWKNRFTWRRYCGKKKTKNGLVWYVLLSTTIFVKTVVKIIDFLNEHDVKKYNLQMFRWNYWIAALYLSYVKALKKEYNMKLNYTKLQQLK